MLEHEGVEEVSVVASVGLGVVRGSLAPLAVDGVMMEHSGGELAAGKVSLEVMDGFAVVRQSSTTMSMGQGRGRRRRIEEEALGFFGCGGDWRRLLGLGMKGRLCGVAEKLKMGRGHGNGLYSRWRRW